LKLYVWHVGVRIWQLDSLVSSLASEISLLPFSLDVLPSLYIPALQRKRSLERPVCSPLCSSLSDSCELPSNSLL